jgi:hypothetical protein
MDKARKCATKNGWDLDESLCMYDLGLSGFHAVHKAKGELGVFIAAVNAGKIPIPSALIVENLDRLSREAITEALSQFLNIINAGITIATTTDNAIYNSESVSKDVSQIIISISIMMRAYEESLTKQDRRIDAWDIAKRNARDGKKINARCVAWLKLNNKTGEFEIIDKHVETIREIYKLYLEGRGLYGICRILNEKKTQTFHKKTKGWGSTTIRRILTTRAVLGEIQFTKTSVVKDGRRIMVQDGEPIENYYPPIIDEDIFYAAQKRQELRKCAFGKIGEINNLFSKIVKCGYCGATMQYGVRGKNKIKYLTCKEARKKSCDIGLAVSFRYQDLEEAFLSICSRLHVKNILPNDISEHEKEILNTKNKLQTIIQKNEESEKKIRNYTEAIATGTSETVAYFVDLINTEKSLQKELLENKKNISSQLSTLEKMYEETTNSLNNLQEILAQLATSDKSKRLEIRRKLQKNILELVERVNVYPRGKAYKKLLEMQDDMPEKRVKNLYNHKMNTYRSAEFCFRAGGKLILNHNHETGGLKFGYETNEDGLFTDKSMEIVRNFLELTPEELENIALEYNQKDSSESVE